MQYGDAAFSLRVQAKGSAPGLLQILCEGLEEANLVVEAVVQGVLFVLGVANVTSCHNSHRTSSRLESTHSQVFHYGHNIAFAWYKSWY